ncbi:MAG TPA: ComF family protein [Candidatus Polarisedimenticolia bacterium]|nr:ComF family protein [Candidatus Polarisedimenticolia bacterium]
MIRRLIAQSARPFTGMARLLAGAALAPDCPACGAPMGSQAKGICADCWAEVDDDRFPAGPQPAGSRHLDSMACVGPYRGRLRAVIRCLKFAEMPGLAWPLAERLAPALVPEAARPDAVVAVPLHWARRWRRGYNQSELLARGVARLLRAGRPLPALKRARRTAPQPGRSRRERVRNVRGAFEASAGGGRLEGARVLLVDDIVTTGATLRECARVLRQAGAREVHAAAVGRTLTRNDS